MTVHERLVYELLGLQGRHLVGVGSEIEIVSPQRDQPVLVDIEEASDGQFEPPVTNLEPVDAFVDDPIAMCDL